MANFQANFKRISGPTWFIFERVTSLRLPCHSPFPQTQESLPMTTTPSSSIHAIDKLSVHQITSGQVVIDLQTSVKELVENSLDAGATNIEVKFKEYGLASVEVIDNGSGIASEDYESIGVQLHNVLLLSFHC